VNEKWTAQTTPWSRKKQDTQLLSIFSPNIDRFSKFFHWYTQQEICNKDDHYRSRHTIMFLTIRQMAAILCRGNKTVIDGDIMHYTECTECCLIYNKLGVVGTRQCVLWRSRFSCSCIRYSLDFRLTNCLRTHNNIHQCANTDKLIQQAVVRGTTNPPPHAAT